MPTILIVDGYRILIYTRDHSPPHVHVLAAEREAIFILQCPEGPPQLRQNKDFTTKQLRTIFEILQSNVEFLCSAWEAIHVYG